MRFDAETYLPEDVLTKVDRMSMAHSIESRVPLLDNEVIAFASALPASLKIKNGRRKHVLKEVAATLLPRDILDRRKQGFGVPLGIWFRGNLRELFADTLLSPASLSADISSRPSSGGWSTNICPAGGTIRCDCGSWWSSRSGTSNTPRGVTAVSAQFFSTSAPSVPWPAMQSALMETPRLFSELGWHSPCSDERADAGAPIPIAVVMTSFEPGGTERQMIELIRRLDPRRWTVHVACFRARGAWFARVAEAAASVTEFPVDSVPQSSTRARRCRPSPAGAVRRASPWSTPPSSTRTSSRLPAPRWPACRSHWQPPRDQSGQEPGADRDAARGLRLRAQGRRQFARGGRPSAARAGRRRARSPSSRTGSTVDQFAPRDPQRAAAQGRHGRESPAGKGTRRADRRGRRGAARATRTRGSRSSAADPSCERCSRARKLAASCTRSHSSAIGTMSPARLADGRHLCPAVAIRGVSKRRPRSDGRRPSHCRVRRRRHRRADRRRAAPVCSSPAGDAPSARGPLVPADDRPGARLAARRCGPRTKRCARYSFDRMVACFRIPVPRASSRVAA